MYNFRCSKERVWQKIHNWKNNFLSKVGKEVLMKTILQAIYIYSISVFKLPRKLRRDIEAMISKFWWCHNNKERGIKWGSWTKFGVSKAKGRVGFKDMECFNRVMLTKQGWRMMQEPYSLVAWIYKEEDDARTLFTSSFYI